MSLLFFIFGLIIGSFLNVIILRLKDSKSLLGRSKCPVCGQVISWYDNIPVLSFILLAGRCRACKNRISWQYPLVELSSGILWLAAYFFSSDSLEVALVLGIFFNILLTLFIFDLRWYILPDQITLLGIAVALLANVLLGKHWQNIILTALVGGFWFGWQYLISRGTWVGSGDIRLGVLMGAMLASWQGLGVALFLAYISGASVAIILLLLGKKTWSAKLPFGAFLTATTVISLLWGEAIWGWYWWLIGW